MYVCHEESRHELHSVKEIFTCEYEAIILSPLLCLHQDYVIKTDTEIDINCYPLISEKSDSLISDTEKALTELEANKEEANKEEANKEEANDRKEKKSNRGKPADVVAFEERMEAESVKPEVSNFTY